MKQSPPKPQAAAAGGAQSAHDPVAAEASAETTLPAAAGEHWTAAHIQSLQARLDRADSLTESTSLAGIRSIDLCGLQLLLRLHRARLRAGHAHAWCDVPEVVDAAARSSGLRHALGLPAQGSPT